jgi:hypothetical protein
VHHSEIAGLILIVLAVLFVPTMYWFGRGRDPLGLRKHGTSTDDRKRSPRVSSPVEQQNQRSEPSLQREQDKGTGRSQNDIEAVGGEPNVDDTEGRAGEDTWFGGDSQG